jgi:uncharacterized protein YceK
MRALFIILISVVLSGCTSMKAEKRGPYTYPANTIIIDGEKIDGLSW